MSGPHVVLPPDADVDAEVRPLLGAGWQRQDGFGVPEEPWDLGEAHHLAVGALRTEEDAAAALLVAVRGGGIVVTLDQGQPWAAGFVADLRRIGAADSSELPDSVELTEEQRRLLELLARGTSIAAAARTMYLSLRTANRRIAEARAALGAQSTSEAVVAYIRMRDAGR